MQQVGSLPALPLVLMRINDLVNNPKTSALELSRVILEDQALTARLLRLVNSPFYGFPRRIATVTEALTILGFHQVRNLLLTVTVVDLLGGEETAEFSPMRLWRHAVGTAVAAGLLARQVCPEDREGMFVAGLLHDVGKLVECEYLREEFMKALLLARAEDMPMRAAEQRVLGFSHDQVSRLLANQWKLPIRLTEAMTCHHRPDLAQAARREAAIVHLADILCHALGLGSGDLDAVPSLDEEAWKRLRLPLGVLEPLMAELEEKYEAAQESLLAHTNSHPTSSRQLAYAR
jgi:putative nucleotidyltransferase with HDIG domain